MYIQLSFLGGHLPRVQRHTQVSLGKSKPALSLTHFLQAHLSFFTSVHEIQEMPAFAATAFPPFLVFSRVVSLADSLQQIGAGLDQHPPH